MDSNLVNLEDRLANVHDQPLIEFKHVEKKFRQMVAVRDFNLQIQNGEFFVLVGPSGSGKTTTLKMVNRLYEPTAGNIKFLGKNVTAYPINQLRWHMGYVLQKIALFPNLTVAENIALIPEMKGISKSEITSYSRELLKRVQLAPDIYLKRMPAELSGGEAQRVGIVRALASKPPIMLMDEPFSALDPLSRTQLQDLILDLHHELKTTIIFVTHDMKEAMKLGDRIGVMHEGELLQTAKPVTLATDPVNDFVASFFKAKDVLTPLQYELNDVIADNDHIEYTATLPEKSVKFTPHENLNRVIEWMTQHQITVIYVFIKQTHNYAKVSTLDILNFIVHQY
ncbi:ABC transporter ATP-binding protein [Lactobacillus sp. CC-MHH1034]|uniref:ABC transporter ATP-binding protein n=1 Tax=Agrilactobacillus fermenti TaxID=2586909 RepID=UPI0038B29142|nr:ABC transporter ATP-binding protein [Agrilactobacillus fermenti]